MKAAERIRLSIEESIRDGSLLPGDAVDEQQLMQTYEVSRTPVREALLQLQAQGLLNSLPRGGMVVAKMDVAQLLAMWELLAELEGIGARLACERMTPAEREELAAIHERAGAVARREDAEAWQDHNRRFHDALYQGARNPYLRQEILRMRSRTGAYPPPPIRPSATWLLVGAARRTGRRDPGPGRGPRRHADDAAHESRPGLDQLRVLHRGAACWICWPEAGVEGTDRRRIRPAAGPTAGKS